MNGFDISQFYRDVVKQREYSKQYKLIIDTTGTMGMGKSHVALKMKEFFFDTHIRSIPAYGDE